MKKCLECNGVIPPHRRNRAKYCTDDCRIKAQNKRQKLRRKNNDTKTTRADRS